jgi:putative DNA primase/helicase
MLDAALSYAARGWPVFPCHPQTKRPLVKSDVEGEGGLKLATIDEAQIRAWWRRWPDAMIGIPTGAPIGAFVVDLDAGTDAKTGEIFEAKALRLALCEALGVALPATWEAETPRGGRHIFYAVPAGRAMPGNRANMIARVDIRGDGGYVVVAPSKRSDGGAYRWVTAPHSRPLAQAPARLVDMVLREGDWAPEAPPAPKASDSSRSAVPQSLMSDVDAGVRDYALSALDRECGDLARMGQGGRNQALNIAAVRLAELCAAGVLDQGLAQQKLEEAAAQNGLVKEDGMRSVRNTIRSGFRKGLQQPRDLTAIRDNVARRKARGESSSSSFDPRPVPPDYDEVPFDAGPASSAPRSAAPPAPASSAAAEKSAQPSHSGGFTANSGDLRSGAGVRAGARRGGDRRDFTPTGKADLDRRLAFFPLTDLGNAERFRERMRGRLIFCAAVGWLHWDKRHWTRRGADEVVKRAEHEVVRAIQDEADALAESGDDIVVGEDKNKEAVFLSDRIHSWGRLSEANSHLTPIAKHAAAYLAVAPDDLDADPFAVNVRNGTLFIRKRDGRDYITFRPHDPADLITKLADVDYDPKADCPLYDRFLAEVQADDAARRFLHQWKGLSLTGDVTEQRLCVFWGKGKNGKSVFEDLMASIAGDYSETVPIETFLSEGKGRNAGQATPDLAILPGVRMLRTSEPQRNASLNEGLIKLATGGEPIQARHLNRDYFKFYPQFKLTIQGNYRPKIEGADEGIWRRMILVPWSYTVPKERQDKRLGEKLRAEASGILNRLLDGLCDWLDHGLVLPEAAEAATREYRSDSDPLGRFLEACVVEAPGERVQSSALHAVFCAWADANGASKWTPTGFGRAMNERGFQKKQSDVIWWLDLRLLKKVSDFVDANGKPIAQGEQERPADAAAADLDSEVVL